VRRREATEQLRQSVQGVLGCTLDATPAARVGGGSIAECMHWQGATGDVFLKLAPVDRRSALEAEATGLAELAAAAAIRVPAVLGTGAAGATAWLALEWIDFRTPGRHAEAVLGERLAALHRVGAPRFGWHRDNTIGGSPQRNPWDDDWARFFVRQRLAPQLALAERSGASARLLDRGRHVCGLAGALFAHYRPLPSLLHGDLWGGNWAADARGEPVVFDPAVYFGDREADLAMTRLFGGFGPAFYAAYQSDWPLDQAAGTRRGFYNLSHLLNHLNLFGGGYAAQAEGLIDGLLAELGH
jgi:fructosamine-3-kinase